ncbi:MAG: hypothetical protein GY696_40580 [Gammaproteobacteria bacterium]|nr:hypothetical protein [Gammaproteobacteria bacterium]
MEEDQGDQDDHLLPEPDQEPLEGLPEEEDVDMEDQDPGSPEIRSPPRTRGWAGRQRNGLRTEDEARAASPDQGEEQPMDYQQAAVPEERGTETRCQTEPAQIPVVKLGLAKKG